MKYNELATSTNKTKRRLGRGISSGRGKTAGRGTKGQNSRAGSSRKPGFDGGQNPLMQRLPKLRGFKSHKPVVENIYTGQLDTMGVSVDTFVAFEAGLISSPHNTVKLIQNGPVTKKHTVKLQLASDGAVKAVEKAGGSFQAIPRVAREPKKAKSDSKTDK